MPPTDLVFRDHHRMSYASLELRDRHSVAEFNVSGGELGEFAILLRDLNRNAPSYLPRRPLAVQFQVFDDGFRALLACVDAGVLDRVEKAEIWRAADLSALLVEAGLTDRSDYPTPQVPCGACSGSGLVPPEPEALGGEDRG